MNIALTGVAIALMATLGGIVIVRRNSPQQPIPVKAVLFGLYFWGWCLYSWLYSGCSWAKHSLV
jgi:hypothetical protein